MYLVLRVIDGLANYYMADMGHEMCIRDRDRVEEMLTAAMEGRFAEEHFDESRLSALEARLARYLTASETSAGRVRQEKDRLAGLVADIAHQTRTPVANLRLYSQLLAEQPLSPAGQDLSLIHI